MWFTMRIIIVLKVQKYSPQLGKNLNIIVMIGRTRATAPASIFILHPVRWRQLVYYHPKEGEAWATYRANYTHNINSDIGFALLLHNDQ